MACTYPETKYFEHISSFEIIPESIIYPYNMNGLRDI